MCVCESSVGVFAGEGGGGGVSVGCVREGMGSFYLTAALIWASACGC